MTSLPLASDCPFNLDGTPITGSISTDSGCVILADQADGVPEFEDLLFDGAHHSHHDGGFAVSGRTIGTHLPFDGTFAIGLYNDAADTVGLTISLQHIADTFHDMDERALDGNGHADTPEHGHDAHPDGWSAPQRVPVTGRITILGDPAAIIDGDIDATLAIRWPAEAGHLMFSAHSLKGFRDTLAFAWGPQN